MAGQASDSNNGVLNYGRRGDATDLTAKHVHKRNQNEREADSPLALKLYLRGMTFSQIANAINERAKERGLPYVISWRQARKDVEKMLALWREKYLDDINKAKQAELAKIDTLEQEYMDAWEKSKKDRVKMFSEHLQENESGKKDEEGKDVAGIKFTRDKARKLVEGRDGDVRYLAGIQWCINKRCQILGLNAPAKLEVKDWRKEAQAAGVDNPDEIVDDLAQQFIDAATRGLSKEDAFREAQSKIGDGSQKNSAGSADKMGENSPVSSASKSSSGGSKDGRKYDASDDDDAIDDDFRIVSDDDDEE